MIAMSAMDAPHAIGTLLQAQGLCVKGEQAQCRK
jgi:hypothetical protein